VDQGQGGYGSAYGQGGAPVADREKKVGQSLHGGIRVQDSLLRGVNFPLEDGITVAKLIVDIANRREVRLKVDDGAELILQVGRPPVH